MTIEEMNAFYQTGRHSLIDFSMLTDRDYDPFWLHEKIAQALEGVASGKIKRLVLEVPPRHGKSQLATINFPAWFLGKNPKKEVIVACYNDGLAQDFGAKTRDLVNSEEYKAIFATRLNPNSQSKAKWETTEGGAYTSVGVGGSLTGRGADLLIIDDPVKNREEAESDVYRNRVWDWYTSTARTRLEKDACIIIIMTRWHMDDLTGRILERAQESGEHWERITFPAIAVEDEEFRKEGDPLWVEKYDKQALKLIEDTIGSRDWFALYQQTPIQNEHQLFKDTYFKYFEEEDLTNRNLQFYTSVDLAISQSEQADNTVIRTIAKSQDSPNIYLIDETAGKFNPGQTIDAFFMHVEKYKPIRIGFESVAFQKALGFYITEEQRKRGLYFPVEEIRSTKDKTIRISGLEPMYRAGVIFHRQSDKELEKELLQFPAGKHDDRIDALEMAISLLQQTTYKQEVPLEVYDESQPLYSDIGI